MTEATLAFVREDAAPEDTRSVDVAALVDSVVADLAELGQPVSFAGAERAVLACRPTALRRALRNLIENAATHGKRASVAFESAALHEVRPTMVPETPTPSPRVEPTSGATRISSTMCIGS